MLVMQWNDEILQTSTVVNLQEHFLVRAGQTAGIELGTARGPSLGTRFPKLSLRARLKRVQKGMSVCEVSTGPEFSRMPVFVLTRTCTTTSLLERLS